MHIFRLGSSLKSLSFILYHWVWLFFRLGYTKDSKSAIALAGQRVVSNEINPSLASSPRRSHLCDVGDRTIATGATNMLFSSFFELFIKILEIFSQQEPARSSELMNTLIKAFSSYGNVDSDLFRPIDSYFERLSVPTGHVLWTQYDISDGLYVIESGVLRASYEFANPAQHFEESMVAGTLAGELSALSDSTRNATVIVEQAAVLWKLSIENIRRLQMDEPELARTFIQLVLKGELPFIFTRCNLDY